MNCIIKKESPPFAKRHNGNKLRSLLTRKIMEINFLHYQYSWLVISCAYSQLHLKSKNNFNKLTSLWWRSSPPVFCKVNSLKTRVSKETEGQFYKSYRISYDDETTFHHILLAFNALPELRSNERLNHWHHTACRPLSKVNVELGTVCNARWSSVSI